jgi:transcriptional regulator of acetoin/glycerol metabolism
MPRDKARQPEAKRPAGLPRMRVMRPAAGSDTMLAWERFLTGDPQGISPVRNFVVASWQRSLQLGVNPTGRAAPLAVEPNAIEELRRRHRDLLAAAAGIFADAKDLFVGSNAIMLLTNPDGVVLEVVGDLTTMAQGREINLTQGGDWREVVVGTNGIGTALATGRPAQVHAAEHFCEGIKRWTCAASPIYEPGTGAIMGVIDISGPPCTYQRNNLTLAVATARQIEAVLAERAAGERTFLLETCLARMSSADAAGLILLDRTGRLVHANGRVPAPVGLGERLPGLDPSAPIEDWADRLPANWRAEWFHPVRLHGRAVGALLVVPDKPRSLAGRPGRESSELDPARDGFEHIVGRSEAMLGMIAHARQLARRRVPVLIEGETGTGKELLARAIHAEGDGDRPFIVFNCGLASRELFAAELFGHVRGAYTGASAEGRPGRFELAHQGTLCLDEIGEMPLDVQPMLLRALDEGVVYRLGDSQPRRVDVRLIAMTNRTLREEAAAGRFRRDLFYRIGATAITIPPLRDRAGDIERLVAHFSLSLASRHDLPPRRFPPDVMQILNAHGWDGNVRELRNVVQALLLADTDEPVRPEELPGFLRAARPAPASAPAPAEAPQARLVDAEREAIRRAIAACDGNHSRAAEALGISRSTLYRKLRLFGA